MTDTIMAFLVAVVLFVFMIAIWLQADTIAEYEDQLNEFTRCVAFRDNTDPCLYILIPEEEE